MFFERIDTIFVFGDSEFRQNLVEAIYPILGSLSTKELIDLGKDSTSGNVIALYSFVERNHLINAENLRVLLLLEALKFINDSYVFELIPSVNLITLDLNERVATFSTEEIEKAALICEVLLDNGIFKRNDKSIRSLRTLYKYSSSELKPRETIEIVPERQPTLNELQKRIDQYRELLSNRAEEPVFQAFFEKNPVFLSWHVIKFLAEKSFGGEQFPDLILFLNNKNYVIVELEKPSVKLYNKRGDPTQELSHAEEQVRGYLRWAVEEKEFLRKRGLKNLSGENTRGLLIIGSFLTDEERKKLETHNSSVNGKYSIKTFSDILEENEAILKNLKEMHT